MYTLRPYQQESVDAVLQHFRKQRKPAVVVLPTGAGKSLVIAELARVAKGRVLVLAHVKELVEQNYQKFRSYDLEAGIFSAGLGRKDAEEKTIFGSIQSVARAPSDFFTDFSLLVIDECHRVSSDGEAQYAQVIDKLRKAQPQLCVLGLTATPYRLDSGWIYRFHNDGFMRTEQPTFFGNCVYELGIREMIESGFLTEPVQIDAPVASYDFSSLKLNSSNGRYQLAEVEAVLKDQRRVTPGIIRSIVSLSESRRGVLIFTSSVRHAREILESLPQKISALVTGDTPGDERDRIIEAFKAQKLKFLVNVSVLTTGFDAPHVDVVAILRPTESVSLYQQIVGRGLRLFEGKRDCLVLDYTGVAHNIYSPEIGSSKPREDAVHVAVACPMCEHENDFWGLTSPEGEVIEHYGRKCAGAIQDPNSLEIIPCSYRYRFKNCEFCGAENDIASRGCMQCGATLVDNDTKLREAMGEKEAHVMRPDMMTFEKKLDAKGRERLEVRYYDLDAQHLSEVFFFENQGDIKSFYYSFVRMHLRIPEKTFAFDSIDKVLAAQKMFRAPIFVIARKNKNFWKIREKIFL